MIIIIKISCLLIVTIFLVVDKVGGPPFAVTPEAPGERGIERINNNVKPMNSSTTNNDIIYNNKKLYDKSMCTNLYDPPVHPSGLPATMLRTGIRAQIYAQMYDTPSKVKKETHKN